MATMTAIQPAPRERPILFSAPMVRAILAGRKAQTRRVVKPDAYLERVHGTEEPTFRHSSRCEGYCDYACGGHVVPERWSPYGQPGERLWVRETWGLCAPFDFSDWHRGSIKGADAADVLGSWSLEHRAAWENPDHEPAYWRPSIHMPRWASRITLEVTGVRVERLRDISAGDAIAEGLTRLASTDGQLDWWGAAGASYLGPRRAFEALWDSINAARGFGWGVNPWVWVVEFRMIEPRHG